MPLGKMLSAALLGATVLAGPATASGQMSQSAADTSTRRATPCAPGGRQVLDTQFGPRYAWTLHADRYTRQQYCVYVIQNRSINGKMVLKTKMTINGTTTKDTQRCFGCAAVSFGPGGYDRIVVKAVAYKRGGSVAYTTGWRRIR